MRAEGAGADHAVSAILVAGLLLQLVLGVRLRHTGEGAMIHITFAVVVLILALIVGVRVMGSHSGVAALRRTSGALITIVATQLVLGGVAFLLVNRRGGEGVAPPAEVFVATLHQTLGAILLGCAVLLAVWTRRLLAEPERQAAAASVPRASTS